MALRSPALWMGNPAVQHTAQNDRLFRAGLLRAETGQNAANRPLTAASGVIQGPPGTMGEVTLLSNTQFTVNPARWVIFSSASALGGSYEVTNDAVATLNLTAQDATQYRRSYFGVWVVDSFVAGAGDDLPHWGLVDGPLAASAATATLPAAGSLPANFLALGEFAIPPVGQNVTYTPYDLRTGLRGSIVPVTTTDTRAGSHVGSYRDRPDNGLERWDGANWTPGIGRMVAHGSETAALGTTSTSPTRLAGGQNVTAAPLFPGRAYECIEQCVIGASGVGRETLYVCAALGAVPAYGNVAATVFTYIAGSGGPFQTFVTTAGQMFQVPTAGLWQFHLFAQATSGITLSVIAPFSGGGLGHSIAIIDRGPVSGVALSANPIRTLALA